MVSEITIITTAVDERRCHGTIIAPRNIDDCPASQPSPQRRIMIIIISVDESLWQTSTAEMMIELCFFFILLMIQILLIQSLYSPFHRAHYIVRTRSPYSSASISSDRPLLYAFGGDHQNQSSEMKYQMDIAALDDLISDLKSKLVESENSWFPIRSRGLREQLRQAEVERRRAEDEKWRAEDEKRRAESEQSVIFLEVNEDGILEENLLTRKEFDQLKGRRIYLYKVKKTSEAPSRVLSFEDIIAGGVYYFKSPATNFDSWAKIEGQVQTRDSVQSILRGQVSLPPFDKPGTSYILEPRINFPEALEPLFKELGFGSPFNPYAWIIHDDHWCFLECKHSATAKDLRLFDLKIKSLRPYMQEPWFRGERAPPAKVIGVVSSIASFPRGDTSKELNVMRIVSSGRSYEVVVIPSP